MYRGVRVLNRTACNWRPIASQMRVMAPISRVTAVRRYTTDDPLEKYKEKLLQKAKAEGIETLDELKDKYKDVIEDKKLEFNKIDQYLQPKGAPDKVRTKAGEERKPRGPRPDLPSAEASIKDLDSFVDLEKLKLHDAKEIEMLWKARFADKDRQFCGVVNGETFSRIYRNARKNPNFVLPLPHEEQGAELHFVQWSFVGPFTLHCILTSVAEYKLHQEYARPHTTMIFHSELLTDKSIALMNGNVEADSNLNHDQGLFLSLNVQRFYGADDKTESGIRKTALLHQFNSNAENFSVEALLTETETLD